MTKAEKERMELIELLNTKEVYSRFSHKIITFVNDLSTIDISKGGIWSNGIILLDCEEEVEDDISNMYFRLKKGVNCNCQDFYTENGAFGTDDWTPFLESIKRKVKDRGM